MINKIIKIIKITHQTPDTPERKSGQTMKTIQRGKEMKKKKKTIHRQIRGGILQEILSSSSSIHFSAFPHFFFPQEEDSRILTTVAEQKESKNGKQRIFPLTEAAHDHTQGRKPYHHHHHSLAFPSVGCLIHPLNHPSHPSLDHHQSLNTSLVVINAIVVKSCELLPPPSPTAAASIIFSSSSLLLLRLIFVIRSSS